MQIKLNDSQGNQIGEAEIPETDFRPFVVIEPAGGIYQQDEFYGPDPMTYTEVVGLVKGRLV